MFDGSNVTRIVTRSRIAWVACIVVAGIIGGRETQLLDQVSYSAAMAHLPYGLLFPPLVGVGFIAAGYYVRTPPLGRVGFAVVVYRGSRRGGGRSRGTKEPMTICEKCGGLRERSSKTNALLWPRAVGQLCRINNSWGLVEYRRLSEVLSLPQLANGGIDESY